MARQAAPNNSPVADAVRFAALDLTALTARVEKVLNEELYWFPVRHHSPAIAAQIAHCIRERRPKVVFIEGPSEAQDMIGYLLDPKTRPPVAIYSSFRDDAAVGRASSSPTSSPPRYSAWYPLVSYSPELVAMQAAKQVGARPSSSTFPITPSSARSRWRRRTPRRQIRLFPRPRRITAAATCTRSP